MWHVYQNSLFHSSSSRVPTIQEAAATSLPPRLATVATRPPVWHSQHRKGCMHDKPPISSEAASSNDAANNFLLQTLSDSHLHSELSRFLTICVDPVAPRPRAWPLCATVSLGSVNTVSSPSWCVIQCDSLAHGHACGHELSAGKRHEQQFFPAVGSRCERGHGISPAFAGLLYHYLFVCHLYFLELLPIVVVRLENFVLLSCNETLSEKSQTRSWWSFVCEKGLKET